MFEKFIIVGLRSDKIVPPIDWNYELEKSMWRDIAVGYDYCDKNYIVAIYG